MVIKKIRTGPLQTIIDLCLQANGNIENNIIGFIDKYALLDFDFDITDMILSLEYDMDNEVSKGYYINRRVVSSGSPAIIEDEPVSMGGFSDDFDESFDI